MKETQQQGSQNISQYLKGANFPADRDELQRTVKRNGAPSDFVERINRLPNQRFNTENDVTNAFNQGGQGQSGQGNQGMGNQGNQGMDQGSQPGKSGSGGPSGNVGQGGQTGGTQGKTTRR